MISRINGNNQPFDSSKVTVSQPFDFPARVLLRVPFTRDRVWMAWHILFFLRDGSGGGGGRFATIIPIKMRGLCFIFFLSKLHIIRRAYVKYDNAIFYLSYFHFVFVIRR